ncbi:DUF983 domain-containing protein [Amorphus orientalis]|uniref:Uncharacterized protein (DUF983 family) n=1 Tax=Amorphus orientalis TaxID=649198 RepID=A0AAE4AU79_9HYPH|nr:DUF983 domain-containing protein [Amorphus orientalis]MDQ0317113.1 uncharacterized protein (DUF983 family) [Amorphus orientalis]
MTSQSHSTFGTLPEELPERPVLPAMLRGAKCRCPACGVGSMFQGYLTVRDHCPSCGEELFHHRADDAPPYFTIVIVGHVIVSLVLSVEVAFQPPMWAHALLWGPLTLISCLALLRPIKGALVAYQWALHMHGFDPNAPPEGPIPDPAAEARQ